MPTPIFDAHLDLAYLACAGRDMLHADGAALHTAGPDAPGCLSLPSLQASPVRACLGTIFLEPTLGAVHGGPTNSDPRTSYIAGNAHQAAALAYAQLRCYQSWQRTGAVQLLKRGELRCDDAPTKTPLRMGILLEGTDCLRDPSELAWWHAQGVVAAGLSWANHSRYAAGNADDRVDAAGKPLALTPLGRAIIPELDKLNIVHDASHLSDAALAELLARTNAMVIATHSNCRALLPPKNGKPNQRHLTNETIREISRRGGVIGLNLFELFLLPPGAQPPASIAHAVQHVLHICEVVGHARCVGLGSDMDGGFSALRLPAGLASPAALPALLEALEAAGMPAADCRAFAHGNWERVFSTEALRKMREGQWLMGQSRCALKEASFHLIYLILLIISLPLC